MTKCEDRLCKSQRSVIFVERMKSPSLKNKASFYKLSRYILFYTKIDFKCWD